MGRSTSAVAHSLREAASMGDEDAFIAKFTSTGQTLWSHAYGDGASQRGYVVGVGPDGGVHSGGTFLGVVDFGLTTLTGSSATDTDIWIARHHR